MKEIAMHQRQGADVVKGAVAGVLGGAVASWTMNEFHAGVTRWLENAGSRRATSTDGDDATVKAASAISESLAGHTLTRREKKIAGPIVHYAFGSAIGALYGATSEYAPTTTTGYGLAFGSALWLGADEIGVPAAGLSKPPTEIPASTHATAFAMHLVYGMTLEGVRRLVRAGMGPAQSRRAKRGAPSR